MKNLLKRHTQKVLCHNINNQRSAAERLSRFNIYKEFLGYKK